MAESKSRNENPKIMITGGSGFLGKRIVEEFLAKNAPLKPGVIRVFDIKDYDGEFSSQIEFIKGEIYFITDGKGSNFFKFFDQVMAGAGYKIFPKNLWLPRGLAFSIGAVSEAIAVIMRPIKKYNPKFSRFAVIYTCTDFTFSAEKALKDFGFKPKYSTQKALENTIKHYSIK